MSILILGWDQLFQASAEYFDISDTFASWTMTAYMICGVCHDCDNGTVSGPCWSQENVNGDDDMFYVGTVLAPFAPNFPVLLVLRVLQGIAVASTPIST